MLEKQFRIVAAVVLCAIAFISCVPIRAAAEERTPLEQKLFDAYNGKTFMLRGNYCGPLVKFDEQGRMSGDSQEGDWTICRDIVIQDVRLSPDHLRISGRRVNWYFDRLNKQFRDGIELADKHNEKKYNKLLGELNVTLEVALPPQADQARIESLWSSVFWPAGVDPRETTSKVWRCFLMSAEPEQEDCLDIKHAADGLPPKLMSVEKVGGKVKGPKPRHTPDPDYSVEAKRVRFQGVTVLTVVLDAEGNIARVLIARPLGMGLDAKAAEAIRGWKFDPAKRDGVPVPVLINIEMAFNLY